MKDRRPLAVPDLAEPLSANWVPTTVYITLAYDAPRIFLEGYDCRTYQVSGAISGVHIDGGTAGAAIG